MSLYGLQLWDLSSKHIDIFYVAWRKAIRKLLNLSHLTHSNLLHLICTDLPIQCQLDKRIMAFVYSCSTSKNVCVNACYSSMLYGSRSNVCKSLNTLCARYRINKYDIAKHARGYVQQSIVEKVEVAQEHLITSGAIRDFMLYEGVLYDNDDRDNLHSIITYLCTF